MTSPQESIAKIWVSSYKQGINPFQFYAMIMWTFYIKFPQTRRMKKMKTIYKYLKRRLEKNSLKT